MPKATMTFDLPDEQYDFKCATNGSRYLHILQDMYNAFRDKSKYAQNDGSWDDAYDLFKSVCNENNFDPWEEG
jgi:hypothetical protein